MCENPLGFASDEQPSQAPAAMGGHEDQVAVVVAGRREDGLVDHGVYGGAAGAGHPGRFAILFVLGLVAAIAFKLTWLYVLLAAALVAVLLRLLLSR